MGWLACLAGDDTGTHGKSGGPAAQRTGGGRISPAMKAMLTARHAHPRLSVREQQLVRFFSALAGPTRLVQKR